jgi:paraquat-inducible protein B
MSKQASPAVIGGFVVAAVAIVLAAVFVLGGGTLFHKKVRVVVYFDGSVSGLRTGAAVKFRGIDIGSVKDIRINMPGVFRDPQHVRIPVLLEIDQDRLRSRGVEQVTLDREHIRQLVQLGLRAQLETESIVTGVMYVAIDVRPGTPVVLSGRGKYPEIPSLPSLREELPGKVQDILTNLARVDLAKLAASATTTLDRANRLLEAPEIERAVTRLDSITQHADKLLVELDGLSHSLRPAVDNLGQTATAARNALTPAGPLASQLDATLQEIRNAARSLKRLSDHLDRDPGAVLRGGKSS